jgi:hypothetical protein
MGQGFSQCDFEGTLEEVNKTVHQVQREGLVSVVHENLTAEPPVIANVIRPGTPQQTNLPWRNLPDQFVDGIMVKGLRSTHMGAIVFAGKIASFLLSRSR